MPESSSLHSDREILDLAQDVLREEGFAVEQTEFDEITILFAENQYFILGVVASATFSELILLEDVVKNALQTRIGEVDLGPKSWDTYALLLTREHLPELSDTTTRLFAINYDTYAVRRIVHSGIAASPLDVRFALAPFLAPRRLDDGTVGRDAFKSLQDALVERGFDVAVVERAIAAFRQGGRIDDVF